MIAKLTFLGAVWAAVASTALAVTASTTSAPVMSHRGNHTHSGGGGNNNNNVGNQGSSSLLVGADGSQPPAAQSWALKSYSPLNITANETVVFEWSGITHSVFELPDEAAFAACDFSNALELLPRASSGNLTLSEFEPGVTLFFACNVPGHCQLGMKLEINVAEESGGEYEAGE